MSNPISKELEARHFSRVSVHVRNGKYIKFKDYENYRNFVLKSKEWKEERDDTFASAKNEE